MNCFGSTQDLDFRNPALVVHGQVQQAVFDLRQPVAEFGDALQIHQNAINAKIDGPEIANQS
jgi:hypothetical protein